MKRLLCTPSARVSCYSDFSKNMVTFRPATIWQTTFSKMNNSMPAESPSREDELLQQGWTKRFLAGDPRLKEATEFYESIGLEVHLEPARAEDLACSECHPRQPSTTIEGWYVIYTCPKRATVDADTQDEELW